MQTKAGATQALENEARADRSLLALSVILALTNLGVLLMVNAYGLG